MTTVYIVQQYRGDNTFEFHGVFTTKEKAEQVCANRENWSIGPAVLDVVLPEEPEDWPGFYYPAEIQAVAD